MHFACYDESIFPNLVDIGTYLKFYVTDTCFLLITSEGVTNNEDVYGLPLGCLLGYVQGGMFF